MHFITVRELRSQSAEAWTRLARDSELVITSNGKPVAILSAVSPAGLDESLIALRRARAMTAVESMQLQSMAAGRHRMDETAIEAEIGAARRERNA